MSNDNYRKPSDIQKMANRELVVDQLEYTNEEEYLQVQKRIHDQTFSKPAKTCELCGYPMDYQGHKLSEKEQKWSVHDVCREKMNKMLDRETGIARERRAFGRATKNRS